MSQTGNYNVYIISDYTKYLHYRAYYKNKLGFKEYLKNHKEKFEKWDKANRLKKYKEYINKFKSK